MWPKHSICTKCNSYILKLFLFQCRHYSAHGLLIPSNHAYLISRFFHSFYSNFSRILPLYTLPAELSNVFIDRSLPIGDGWQPTNTTSVFSFSFTHRLSYYLFIKSSLRLAPQRGKTYANFTSGRLKLKQDEKNTLPYYPLLALLIKVKF